MTDNEEKKPRVKLGAAGWIVLLFMMALVGSIVGALLFTLIMYANSIGGQ